MQKKHDNQTNCLEKCSVVVIFFFLLSAFFFLQLTTMDFSLMCHIPIDDDSVVENSPALFDDTSTTSSNSTNSNTTLNSNKSEFDDNNDWNQNKQNVFLLTKLSNHTSIKALPLKNWKEKNVFNPIIITVAKLKRLIWEQVQEEIKLIKDNMEKAHHSFGCCK